MSGRGRTLTGSLGLPTSIRSFGGLLPPDLLASILEGESADGLEGLDSGSYHLELGLSPKDAANRAWSALKGAWRGYTDELEHLGLLQSERISAGEPSRSTAATGLTRERWLLVLLRELGFGRVPVTSAGGVEADGRSYPVSHLAPLSPTELPVHLLGWRVPLDRPTPGLAGAAGKAPHSMLQDLLNRSSTHLWAMVSNGSTLRLLRKNTGVLGPSFLEFDLENIFGNDLFSDFVALFLICHQSRFEPLGDGSDMGSCWLERWREASSERGARALGALREGVLKAIEQLGNGFLVHPRNASLRERIAKGTLTAQDFHRALLRLVYRILFCFVAEDRGILLDPDASQLAKERYSAWFSTKRLRNIAVHKTGDGHSDLWEALLLVLSSLGSEQGCPQLGLVGLGGIFEPDPTDLSSSEAISNRYLLASVYSLSVTRPDPSGPRRMVDYRHLGAEELGSIYESLLEYVAVVSLEERSFRLSALAGNERRSSGSYYTPSSLTSCLLDSALEPLLEEAERRDDPEVALLALKVCDPACGSGHFLVAAAKRIATRLAASRVGAAEPSPAEVQEALHEVISRCIYGVDLNPLALELAKVSLWLEGMQAGRPLNLLDSHLKCGNSLLGASPVLLEEGIPDSAFSPITGDEHKVASSLKRRNRQERAGWQSIADTGESALSLLQASSLHQAMDSLSPRNLSEAHVAAKRLAELEGSEELARARLVADAWCSAFVIPKVAGSPAITQGVLEALQRGEAGQEVISAVKEASARYGWFHWHLEFPHIFSAERGEVNPATGWSGGFDCVIGNPPWERIKLQQQEWFSARMPSIAEVPNAATRNRLIGELQEINPTLYAQYVADLRAADGESHFLRNSSRYPLSGRGDINTYAVFAELDRSLVAPRGRMGVIVPTGIATDATTQHFFKDLVRSRSLVSLYDFENSAPLFEGVHRSFKFCLLTLTGRARPAQMARFAFFAHHPEELRDDGKVFELTPEEISLLNPNTGTCPVFRSRRDAEFTLGIYRRVPVLIREDDPDGNPWGVHFRRLFDMSNDSGLFRTSDELKEAGFQLTGNVFCKGDEVYLPLYEAKMIHHFDHRWATYLPDGQIRDLTDEEHADPGFLAQPRYWVLDHEVMSRLAGRWKHQWFLGFRGITNTTNERTMIGGLFPQCGVGNSIFLILATHRSTSCLGATFSSLAFDFVIRQKLGGTNMNFFYVEQLPVPRPELFEEPCPWSPGERLSDWIQPRVLELTYTAWDMEPLARDLGYQCPPFRWIPERRATIRAELDACFFHLYGIERDDVEYVLGTFPIVARHDEAAFGEFRTKRLVLEAYDAMAKAIASGDPYECPLDPPPGDPRATHQIARR